MTSKGPDYGETVFAQHLMPLESPNSIIIASRTKLDVMQSFAWSAPKEYTADAYLRTCYLQGMVSLCSTGYLASCPRRLTSMTAWLDSSALWVFVGFSQRDAQEEIRGRGARVENSLPALPCWAVGWQNSQLLQGQASLDPQNHFLFWPLHDLRWEATVLSSAPGESLISGGYLASVKQISSQTLASSCWMPCCLLPPGPHFHPSLFGKFIPTRASCNQEGDCTQS